MIVLSHVDVKIYKLHCILDLAMAHLIWASSAHPGLPRLRVPGQLDIFLFYLC